MVGLCFCQSSKLALEILFVLVFSKALELEAEAERIFLEELAAPVGHTLEVERKLALVKQQLFSQVLELEPRLVENTFLARPLA